MQKKPIKLFIFMRNWPCCFTAEQCRSALRNWCLNPKEMKSLSIQGSGIDYVLSVCIVSVTTSYTYKGKVKDSRYMQNKKDSRISLVIIADLFHAKTLEYTVWTWHRGSSKTKQQEKKAVFSMFLPTWWPSTKAVVRPNYNGNQGSSRGVEDEVVVNFLPMSPKFLPTYPNREKDRGIVMAPLFCGRMTH